MTRAKQFVKFAKQNIMFWHPEDEIIDILNSICDPIERRVTINISEFEKDSKINWSNLDEIEQFLNEELFNQNPYILKARIVSSNIIKNEIILMISFKNLKNELMWYRSSGLTPVIQPIFKMNIKELVYEYSDDARKYLDSYRDLNPNAWREYAPRFTESIEWNEIEKELRLILGVEYWTP